MGEAASDRWVGFPNSGEPRRRGPAQRGLSWLLGGIATVAAVTVAAVLTVVFAATLAVAVVLTAALVGLYTLTRANRHKPQGVVIEARRVGHSWVAYGWDQRPR